MPSILYIFPSFSSVLDNSAGLLQQGLEQATLTIRAAVVINNRATRANIAPPDWQPEAVAQPPLGGDGADGHEFRRHLIRTFFSSEY